MHGTKHQDYRETIERSEINSGGLLTQDTRTEQVYLQSTGRLPTDDRPTTA